MKKLKMFLLLYLTLFLIIVDCEIKNKLTTKKFIPYFRHQVEEMEEKKMSDKTEKEDSGGNLVSFLLQNVKEIFNEITDQTEDNSAEETTIISEETTTILEETTTVLEETTPITESITSTESTPIVTQNQPLTYSNSTILLTTIDLNFNAETFATSMLSSTPSTDEMLYENVSLTTWFDNNPVIPNSFDMNADVDSLSNQIVKYTGKTEKKEREIHNTPPIRNYILNSSISDTDRDLRSCILCNNVVSEDCNDPRNKLITSIMCERDDDMCYSMHTPFGIIDRGCFNTNHNLTTYVCSCNLCNFISISEMPYAFGNKQDWTDNVIEISRTRRFRKTVFKEMSCLRCEVNTTRDDDMVDTANCLEGNIGNVPVEECELDEICAVKALRADGYIWRGCIKAPLYNYWWSLCDHDLCNYDTIVSIYDFL